MSGRCRLLCCHNSGALEQDCADIDGVGNVKLPLVTAIRRFRYDIL